MIRTLAKSIRQYKRASIIAPIFMSFEVIMEVFYPYLMANLIDYGINAGDMDYVWKIGFVLFMSAMISMMFGVLSGIYSSKAAAGFAKNLRHDMFYAVQEFSFFNIDKFSAGSLVTRLTTDVNFVQMAYQMIIRMAVRSPLMLVFSLIMSFQVNTRISFVFLGVAPVLGIGLFLIISNVHPIFVKVFDTFDSLNTVVQENLHGIRVVKSYVREEEEKAKFEAVSQKIFEGFTKAEKRIAFNMPLMQLCMYTVLLIISWLSAKMIVGGEMTTGELTSMITYATQILISLMMLSMVFVMIIISKASAERIAEVLVEQSDLQNCEHPAMEVKDGSIIFHNVDFSYVGDKEKLCLEQVNLTIQSGETVGIIGGTGSAKTTFVQLISRLYDVTSGSLEVGGMDVRKIDMETLRNAVAVVLQKNVLFSGTVKENLCWGNEHASMEEMISVCKLAQADDFIRAFKDGYDTYIEQGGTNVSGGQKQRLCIARALLKKPKILILDDSTSALDTKTDGHLRKAMKEEIPNTTKLIIAQRIASVQDADKIIVMEDGKVNGFGTHEQLMKENKIYQEVYESQMTGGDFDE